MNWYKGNIAEAVAKSKANNAIFVVYVEGRDESTQKLSNFINDQRIREKLESDDFVAIKIESDSQAYMQFATIYQVVPVPSIFFIGKTGTPLEIGTGIIASVNELEEKIHKVLIASGRSTPAESSSSTSLIEAEQKAQSSSFSSSRTSTKELEENVTDLTAKVEPTTSSATTKKVENCTQEDQYEVVCEGDVCHKKPIGKISATGNDVEIITPTKSEDVNPATATTHEETKSPVEQAESERLEEARKKMEEQRRKRIEEEKQLEKDRELRRRREGKEMQNIQQWQHEKELKELKENIRREKLEEIAARERIRAQIAADRAERAQKFSNIPGDNAATTSADAAASSGGGTGVAATAPDRTRIQFRFASGNTATHVFNCQDTLSEIREYVRVDLLPGSGIKDFTLATTYPKRDLDIEYDTQTLADLNLFPSAVILIIGKESTSNPAAIIARSGGLLNIFTTLVMTILSPVFSIFGYFKNIATGGGRRNNNADGNGGANKRANEENEAQHDAAKRRNMARFGGGAAANASSGNSPSTSADVAAERDESKPYRRYGSSNIHRLTDHKDSDDENATWNGNSTQQQ